MNSPAQLLRRLAVAFVLAAAAVPAAQAAAAQPEPPVVPDKIQVGTGHKVFLVGHAVGVQIYACKVTDGAYAWTLTAPRADLYDDRGKVIMSHYGGPSWEARDGSKVIGKRVDGVTVDPTAIPWLLLSTTVAPDSAPDGRLTGTKFIQRVATTEGLAPAAGTCTSETLGAVEEIPYTADYYFWKAA